jgi:hypothetical protein
MGLIVARFDGELNRLPVETQKGRCNSFLPSKHREDHK